LFHPMEITCIDNFIEFDFSDFPPIFTNCPIWMKIYQTSSHPQMKSQRTIDDTFPCSIIVWLPGCIMSSGNLPETKVPWLFANLTHHISFLL
jgi:hypothetical protein